MYELDAIAATVIGGTSLHRRRGHAVRHADRRADHGRAAQRPQPAGRLVVPAAVRHRRRHHRCGRDRSTRARNAARRGNACNGDVSAMHVIVASRRADRCRPRPSRQHPVTRAPGRPRVAFVLKTLNQPVLHRHAARRRRRRPSELERRSRGAGGRARDGRRAADADHREPDPDRGQGAVRHAVAARRRSSRRWPRPTRAGIPVVVVDTRARSHGRAPRRASRSTTLRRLRTTTRAAD